jgi:calcineurin-like phosphoesterase family protein
MIKLNQDKKLFFLSDAHLMHANIIKYCNRPFADAQEMTETVIRNWNKVVTDEDQIVFLGDFICGCKNAKETSEYFYECLNGEKHFIRGNHDTDDKMSDKLNWYKNDENLYRTHYKGYDLVLSHYPFERKHFKPLANAIYISGHTHDTDLIYDKYNKCVNVCCEAVNYTPILFENILNELSKNI